MQNGSSAMIPSAIEGRGFSGTIGKRAERDDAWALAIHAIGTARGRSDEAVRAFLDSQYGRHFACEVARAICSGRDLAPAIDSVVLRIDAAIETEIGIPQGLPYLTGFVLMQEALLDAPA